MWQIYILLGTPTTIPGDLLFHLPFHVLSSTLIGGLIKLFDMQEADHVGQSVQSASFSTLILSLVDQQFWLRSRKLALVITVTH